MGQFTNWVIEIEALEVEVTVAEMTVIVEMIVGDLPKYG